MTRDQFKKVLDEKGYKRREEGEWIVLEEPGDIYLNSLESIPDNVQFNNGGYVNLQSLESIPDNVQFRNGGSVDLQSLESIPDNVQFRNGGSVNLQSLKSIPDNIQFNNTGMVKVKSLKSIPISAEIDEMFPKCYDIRINNKWLYLYRNTLFRNYRWKRVDSKVQMYESWVKNNY